MNRRRLRWLSIGGGALAFLLVGGIAGAYAYDASQTTTVAEGVSVGGVDIGGLEVDAARARLARPLAPRLEQPIALVGGGKRFTVRPAALAAHLDLRAMIDAALDRSRSGDFFSRALRELRNRPVHAQLPVVVATPSRSETRLVARVAEALDRLPHAARVQPTAIALHVVPSRPGLRVERGALRRALAERLARLDGSSELRVPVHRIQPRVTTAELARRYPWFITISRGEKRLRLWQRLRLAEVYTIAVGQAGLETPAGLYQIQTKVVDPAWNVPKRPWAGALAGHVIPPGDPENPLKARWLGFFDGAGIHGTDDIASLGTAASHGCIRMSIPDVVDLFDRVPLHTPIFIS